MRLWDTLGVMNDSISYRTLQRTDYPALTKMLCETWHKQDPQMDEDLQMKLAQIDLEYCLARTTTAEVAVRDGEVVGAVLGRIDAQETRKGINQHHRSVMKIMGPLFFNKSAHQALKNMLNAEKADRQMIKQAKKDGHAYDGEIVLFIVREDMRGQGIGQHLFDCMHIEFKETHVEHYYLCTDPESGYGLCQDRGEQRSYEMPVQHHTPMEDADEHQEAVYLDNR